MAHYSGKLIEFDETYPRSLPDVVNLSVILVNGTYALGVLVIAFSVTSIF